MYFCGWVCCKAAHAHSLGSRVGYSCWQVQLYLAKLQDFFENTLAGNNWVAYFGKKSFDKFITIEKYFNQWIEQMN